MSRNTLLIKRSLLNEIFDYAICGKQQADKNLGEDFPTVRLRDFLHVQEFMRTASEIEIINDVEMAEAKFCQHCGRPIQKDVVCPCDEPLKVPLPLHSEEGPSHLDQAITNGLY